MRRVRDTARILRQAAGDIHRRSISEGRELIDEEVTIRTDLKEIHNRGLVYKSYGGAVPPDLVSAEPTLYEKSVENASEKSRIGAAATQLIKDGETIILDSASTTHEISKRIKDRKELTVITNGINIATVYA